MSREKAIDRPVFVLGCGRSGTTVVYDVLSEHEHLAWFSNYTQRTGSPRLAALSRIRRFPDLTGRLGRFAPRPHEGHMLWDACTPSKNAAVRNAPLLAEHLLPDEVTRMRALISGHLRFQGRPRFINKNTRNARRIEYLGRAFPDALFVHVARAPRPAVASLLRVHFWPTLPIWWEGDRTPQQLVAEGRDEVRLAAEFWNRELWQIRTDAERIGHERCLVVRYEDMVRAPIDTFEQMLEFLQLPPSRRVAAAVNRLGIEDRNRGSKNAFSDQQLRDIAELTRAEAGYLGYPAPAQVGDSPASSAGMPPDPHSRTTAEPRR